MKILSLFDGISIAQQALKECGIKVEKYYASEIDKYAISVTQKNFPDTIQLGDVKKVGRFIKLGVESDAFGDYEMKDIDLLIGGSPCQDLSIAKKNRQGLSGERSGLFWEYVRILNEVKPKYFILENVNSMSKEAKQIITETLGVEPIMINASLVSAQNRKRLFWTNIPNVTQPEDKGILLRDVLQSEDEIDPKFFIEYDYDRNKAYIAKSFRMKKKSNTIKTSGRGSGIDDRHNWDIIRVGQIGKGGQGDRIYDPKGKSVSLSANGGGRGAKTGLYAVGVASRTYPRIPNGEKREKRIEIRKDEKANSMTSVSGDSMVLENLKVRKLTLIECERLMTLSDGFTAKGITEKGEVEISNSQRYKMCGNGFVCEVIKHIFKKLI